ncbi:hypothetical protein EIN_143760 [Entamoeba invadens IP1]|uniref:ATP-dependent DNA helicase n=1 Tax=Entamoeba invadens IP1 TaxID=370355 RepID=A0A0A1UF88_ENTIV|nr:hypothetical protein EIN_143760 [Entamoeba invadens IP1]ELP91476.1 hypothetical protein EIN_143760 [Entamoeba invadens IP1]|eukprot:XP_004258247.1 hypothetical protein EIN_143760 [Entamoeba invadens IP1]
MLKENGFSLGDFGITYAHMEVECELPDADIGPSPNEIKRRIESLNPQQRAAFNKISFALEFEESPNRCFFIDGPGGSGKTYLYNTIIDWAIENGKFVKIYALSGIASTLLKGGRTLHSSFKLPLNFNINSKCNVDENSKEGRMFRNVDLILIDEISMVPKRMLQCIDTFLRNVGNKKLPFGGKVVIVGGDFRQTLPVVPHGSKNDIVKTCVKMAPVWRRFEKLELRENMRSVGQKEFNHWLLEVGNGNSD